VEQPEPRSRVQRSRVARLGGWLFERRPPRAATTITKNRREPARHRSARNPLRRALRTVIGVVIVLVAALALRSYVVAPYYVPSESMEPTLHGCTGCDDDHVLVEKLSYRFHPVQRGDIVVFNRPSSWHVPDDVLVKRVVAVAGDHLVIRGGHIYVNRRLIDEPYVNRACRHGTTAAPGSTDTRPKAYPTIPSGTVFVMGDNRCDSDDSRVFGVVPTDKIVGRAFVIVWPLHRLHSL
jgi:signal peptidase I